MRILIVWVSLAACLLLFYPVANAQTGNGQWVNLGSANSADGSVCPSFPAGWPIRNTMRQHPTPGHCTIYGWQGTGSPCDEGSEWSNTTANGNHSGSCVPIDPPLCEPPNQINPITDQCDYCPSGHFDPSGLCLDCPGGDCEGSSSSASSEPICVWGVNPETGDCLPEPSSSSSGNSSAGSSSGGGSASSSGGGNSSSGNGGDDGGSGSSSPGNPVPADSTCPNKFQIGDQWYCQSNPMPSSEGQASSEGADAAAAGTCGAAPVCNGDPVGCAILLNAHYHRCNTDKQSTAAGSCGEEPSCTGDPVGCSVLKQTWLINCQDHQQNSDLVENNFGSGLDGFKTEDEGKFNEFITTLTEEGEETDENGVLTQLAPDRIDLSSQDFGLSDVYAIGNSPSSGSCPPPRTIQLSVGSYEVSYEPFCDLATQLSGFLVLIFSYLSSLLIYRSLQGV